MKEKLKLQFYMDLQTGKNFKRASLFKENYPNKNMSAGYLKIINQTFGHTGLVNYKKHKRKNANFQL